MLRRSNYSESSRDQLKEVFHLEKWNNHVWFLPRVLWLKCREWIAGTRLEPGKPSSCWDRDKRWPCWPEGAFQRNKKKLTQDMFGVGKRRSWPLMRCREKGGRGAKDDAQVSTLRTWVSGQQRHSLKQEMQRKWSIQRRSCMLCFPHVKFSMPVWYPGGNI